MPDAHGDAAAAMLREEILGGAKAVVRLDLAPDKTEAQLLEQLDRPRGSRSLASHWQRTVGMQGVQAGLLREFVPQAEIANAARLAYYIKQLPVPLIAARPLDEAISSAGGVMFAALDEHLMLRDLPGVFCAGEMLDWEAPTGGYLLTACFQVEDGRAWARCSGCSLRRQQKMAVRQTFEQSDRDAVQDADQTPDAGEHNRMQR